MHIMNLHEQQDLKQHILQRGLSHSVYQRKVTNTYNCDFAHISCTFWNSNMYTVWADLTLHTVTALFYLYISLVEYYF